MSSNNKKKHTGWIISIIIVVVILAVAILVVPRLLSRRANSLANIRTVTIQAGNIEKTVTGTGNLDTEITMSDLEVLDGLKIDQILVESDDPVKRGDVLATFDPAALQSAIRDTQSELSRLDAQLNQLKGKKESIYLTSSLSGRIKQVFLAEGDRIDSVMAEKGALMVLSLDGLMKVTVEPAASEGLAAGSNVLVILPEGSKIDGEIQKITPQNCVVTLADKKPTVGDQVTVVREDGTEIGRGLLEINQPLPITGTSGIAASILRNENDSVQKGTRLIKLEEAEASWNYQDLYSKRMDLADRLQTLLNYAQSNSLLSAVDGTIRSVNLTEGRQTGSGTAGDAATGDSQTAFSVETSWQCRLSVSIDELDIALLSKDQPVRVTLDALPDLILTETIAEIADTGTVSQGGASYPVRIDIPPTQGMKAGMSATAVISVERRENVVRLPLEALQELGKEQFVYIGTPVSSTNLGEKRVVTVGISDGQFIEIKSGLSIGDQVNYWFDDGSQSLFPFGGRFANQGNTATSSRPTSLAPSDQ
jgi:multidrug efflux pump subunit AcrA (membrane-fusion protein)